MFSQPRQRTVRSFRLSTIGAAAALIVGGALTVTTAFAGMKDHSGASVLNIVLVQPNEPRCGAAPPNFEVHFEGYGMETELGPFSSAASACQNVETLKVTDLVAIDTGANGAIEYRSAPFTFTLDPATCLQTAHKVKYTGEGLSGDYIGGRGKGKYDIYALGPECSGAIPAGAMVHFRGWWE
jgi:hypothetical protein